MPLPLLPLLLHQPPPSLCRALRQEGVPCAEWTDAPRAGRFVLGNAKAPKRPELAAGQTMIDVAALNEPGNTLTALADERSARRGWRVGPLAVSEEVARVDKRTARRQVMTRLRSAVEEAGGVWLRLAAYPHPYRGAFNFRFDHDDFVPKYFDAVMDAIAGHEGATTHYVCASQHAGQQAALARLRGMDVGGHGWWHHTYRDGPENLANIRRGLEGLFDAGLSPAGFAAPHGRWNRGLAAALDALGVTHSSEFALCYDDWPLEPPSGGALQLPIYPVCLGIALEAAQSQHEALAAADVASWLGDHFRKVIAAKHRAGEPIFLYGHPDGRLGRFPHLVRNTLLAAAALPDVWRTTHSQFAAWWRARLGARISVERQGEELLVTVDGAPHGHTLALECWNDNRLATVPLDRPAMRFQPAALAYETRPADDTPRGELLDASPGLRCSLRRLLDWERVTPIDELRVRTVRGWLKKSLRRIRDHAHQLEAKCL